MIEKCSIGKMRYSLQNISLMILILILIIVILFYIKSSESRHNELIEKYANTNIAEDTYGNNNSAGNTNGFFFIRDSLFKKALITNDTNYYFLFPLCMIFY